MADDKNGRDKQAHDAERRQREREIIAALERADETEPPIEEDDLADLEPDLETLAYPVTGAEVVAAVGDRVIESPGGSHAVAELIPDVDEATFESPASVRVRIQRPAVAAAMKRVLEASATLQNETLEGSQWEAYERTFRELAAIDADDEDEGVAFMTDWIVERIREKGTLPGSRAVRREAAKFCRANGYQVRNDEWLGV